MRVYLKHIDRTGVEFLGDVPDPPNFHDLLICHAVLVNHTAYILWEKTWRENGKNEIMVMTENDFAEWLRRAQWQQRPGIG